ncbi:hypothetical protein [Shewanella gaetbuli]|uniref:Uncharacterized protein n=1 Tax=Shewanella gaetbuli TaxID=220752 RepID=A0A9X1ZK35_9GAMM|nr:hypothetical protein [Shewanella gaetbuli]MCL1142976.1 hypothetical protein [Shewanella gaetbuli]
MATKQDDIFDTDPKPTTNLFGGDVDDEFVQATPEERGDVILDEPEEETEVEETEEESEAKESDDESEEETEENEEEPEESEDESDADEELDEEQDEDEKPKKKAQSSGKVPRSRLNKEIRKRRELEARLRELEQGKEQSPQSQKGKSEPEPEPVALKDKISKDGFHKMQEAMIDGNSEEAFELFTEMMTNVASTVSEAAAEKARQEALGEIQHKETVNELSKTASELAERYPELDHESDMADEGLIEEVVETRNLYIDRGMSPAEALRKAVRLVAIDNELVDRKAEVKKPKAPSRIDALDRKTELSKKERGRLGGGSKSPASNDRSRIANLSDPDFARLSDEARRRARGDYL